MITSLERTLCNTHAGVMAKQGMFFRKDICPACNGGFSHERSFSVFEMPGTGRIGWKCWRASCGVTGAIAQDGKGARPQEATAGFPISTGERFSTLLAQKQALTVSEIDSLGWCLRLNFEDVESDFFSVPGRGVGIFFRDRVGRIAGAQLRQTPWKAISLAERARGLWPENPVSFPKALTYLREEGGLALDVLRGNDGGHTVIVVEDPYSARRVRSVVKDPAVVALMGTDICQRKALEISRLGKNVILALDPDAYAKGLRLARKWGPAFQSVRVALLSADPKDLSDEEISEAFA